MKTTNYTDLRKNLKENLDNVIEDNDPLIVYRPHGESVVVISLDEYNALKETEYLLSNQANAAHLKKSIDEAEKGETETIDTNDLWK